MVQPERFPPPGGWDIRQCGARHTDRTGDRGRGFLGTEEHRNLGADHASVPRRVLQHLEPRELQYAEHGSVYFGHVRYFADRRRGYLHIDHIPPNSVRAEADLVGLNVRIQRPGFNLIRAKPGLSKSQSRDSAHRVGQHDHDLPAHHLGFAGDLDGGGDCCPGGDTAQDSLFAIPALDPRENSAMCPID